MTEAVAFARAVADQSLDGRRTSQRTIRDADKAEEIYSGQFFFIINYY